MQRFVFCIFSSFFNEQIGLVVVSCFSLVVTSFAHHSVRLDLLVIIIVARTKRAPAAIWQWLHQARVELATAVILIDISLTDGSRLSGVETSKNPVAALDGACRKCTGL